jgi:hypothetical protein
VPDISCANRVHHPLDSSQCRCLLFSNNGQTNEIFFDPYAGSENATFSLLKKAYSVILRNPAEAVNKKTAGQHYDGNSGYSFSESGFSA